MGDLKVCKGEPIIESELEFYFYFVYIPVRLD